MMRNFGVWTICPTAPTSKRLTFKVPNAVFVQPSAGSSLSDRVLAFAAAAGVYRLVNVGAGAPPGPRAGAIGFAPLAVFPPTSAPRHQTPDRSGCPSAVRGTAEEDAALAAGPDCAARRVVPAVNHTSVAAIAAVRIERFTCPVPPGDRTYRRFCHPRW